LYFVYVLENPEGQLYIGFTTNLEKRGLQHQPIPERRETITRWKHFLSNIRDCIVETVKYLT